MRMNNGMRACDMTERELRNYKRRLHRQRAIRRRCMTVIMTFCLIAIGVLSYHALQSSASTGSDVINYKYYTSITVEYGETLWDIADEYIDYNEYSSKAQYISEVKRMNHLSNVDVITAGQSLIVPYYSTEFIE